MRTVWFLVSGMSPEERVLITGQCSFIDSMCCFSIVFLTGFEDELSKAMHLRSESKEEGSRSKLIIKAEVSDVYVKTDSSPSNRDTRPSGTLFLQTSDVKDVKILA